MSERSCASALNTPDDLASFFGGLWVCMTISSDGSVYFSLNVHCDPVASKSVMHFNAGRTATGEILSKAE